MNLIINTIYVCLKTCVYIYMARLIHFSNGLCNASDSWTPWITPELPGPGPAVGSRPGLPPSFRGVPRPINQGPQLYTVCEFRQKLFLLCAVMLVVSCLVLCPLLLAVNSLRPQRLGILVLRVTSRETCSYWGKKLKGSSGW